LQYRRCQYLILNSIPFGTKCVWDGYPTTPDQLSYFAQAIRQRGEGFGLIVLTVSEERQVSRYLKIGGQLTSELDDQVERRSLRDVVGLASRLNIQHEYADGDGAKCYPLFFTTLSINLVYNNNV
jgi:hypothetical protein